MGCLVSGSVEGRSPQTPRGRALKEGHEAAQGFVKVPKTYHLEDAGNLALGTW